MLQVSKDVADQLVSESKKNVNSAVNMTRFYLFMAFQKTKAKNSNHSRLEDIMLFRRIILSYRCLLITVKVAWYSLLSFGLLFSAGCLFNLPL